MIKLLSLRTISERTAKQQSTDHNISGVVKREYRIHINKDDNNNNKNNTGYSTILVKLHEQKDGYFVAHVSFSSDAGSQKDMTSITESELADVIGKYSVKRFRISAESKFDMNITIESDQNKKKYNYGYFVAHVSFSSDAGSQKDITSITESELADLANKYRIFIDCIRTEEQKELQTMRRNLLYKIFSRSSIRRVSVITNAAYMKKHILAQGSYMKDAALTAVKVKEVISGFNALKNNIVNTEIYTMTDIDGVDVRVGSTIELDADVCSIISNELETANLAIRNFLYNVHMSTISLSTFFSLNKVNRIFQNCGMIIGCAKMGTTPVSIYNGYSFIFADPSVLSNPLTILTTIGAHALPMIYFALPVGFLVLIPRIARFVIKRQIRKKLRVHN